MTPAAQNLPPNPPAVAPRPPAPALTAPAPAPTSIVAPTVPIVFSIAQEHDRPVVDDAWIDAHLTEANRLYQDVPLRFVRAAATGEGPPPAPRLSTRADRDAAAGRLPPGKIHVRVVASLEDVDEPGRPRRGVHWHLRRDPARHYIILSAIAAPGVLGHELGHFFGNPHSPVPDNLMCYTRTGGPVSLDQTQIERVRHALRLYLRSGELRRVPPDVEPR